MDARKNQEIRNSTTVSSYNGSRQTVLAYVRQVLLSFPALV